MDYSKVSDVQKIPEMTQACAKSSATRAIPSSEAAQRGITEFSKEASDAISAASKAAINIQKYNPDQTHRFVAKGALDPALDILRNRILNQAGVYDDETIKELTTSVIKVDDTKSSKFLPAKELNIENFAITTDDAGIRGSSPFSRKGRKVIAKLKDYGIKRVIDLKSDGDPLKNGEICAKSGLEYMKFPIAYDEKWTQENIDLIPEFVETLKKGDFYIGCATGMHRTDTALALNYFFNPHPLSVPKLEAGTSKNKTTAIANKIFSAVNDICYTDKKMGIPRLSEEFATKLGWDNLKQMLDEIPKRKATLSLVNKIL